MKRCLDVLLAGLLATAAFSLACAGLHPCAAGSAADKKEGHKLGQDAVPVPSAKNVRKHALLVGCTRYPNLAAKYQLKGPANDVVLLRQALTERFGFPDENIVTLAEAAGDNHKPTRQNIRREFDRLAQTAGKGDRIVVLLAGHGSQQPDQEPFDEPDGLDETFFPADVGAWSGKKGAVTNAIVDDELGVWTKAIVDKGASVWVIVDACHSGTMLRGDALEVAREVPAEALIPRAVLDQARRDAVKRFQAGALAHWYEDLPGIVALYAAQATEVTYERPPGGDSDDKWYGLFTYTLCKVLMQAQSPLTYRELTLRIHAEYVRGKYATGPVPLVEGQDQDREVLGLRAWPGRSRFVLEGEEPVDWKVTGGQLHGLTKGSILAVFLPAGAADADKPLGHVRIHRCFATDAQVVACAHAGMPAPQKLPVGGRCALVYLDYGSMMLSVAVEGQDDDVQVRALKQQLRGLAHGKGSLLELAAQPSQADWRFQIEQDQAYLLPADPALPPDKQPRVTPRFGPYPLGEFDRITARLEQIVRARNLMKLTAAPPAEAARGPVAKGETNANPDVELTLVKLRSKEDRQGTPIDWKDRGPLLVSGDLVAFRVHNRAPYALDISLLFVDAGFGIHPVFPRPNIAGDNRLQPGDKYLTRAIPVNANTNGLEHVVLIAVRGEGAPLDFTCLAQPTLELAARGTAPMSLRTPLGLLLSSALYGGATRGVASNEYALRLVSWHVAPANMKKNP